MIYLYVKPKVKKNHTTAVTIVIIKLALGDYIKTAIKLLGKILSPSTGFSPNLNSPYMVGAISIKESRWNIFGKIGNTGV